MLNEDLINLFETFSLDEENIVPQLSDDWKYFYQMCSSGIYIEYYSEKLNQRFKKVNVYDFLNFVEVNNVHIQGNTIIGKFAIDKNKNLRTEELFLEFLSIDK